MCVESPERAILIGATSYRRVNQKEPFRRPQNTPDFNRLRRAHYHASPSAGSTSRLGRPRAFKFLSRNNSPKGGQCQLRPALPRIG